MANGRFTLVGTCERCHLLPSVLCCRILFFYTQDLNGCCLSMRRLNRHSDTTCLVIPVFVYSRGAKWIQWVGDTGFVVFFSIKMEKSSNATILTRFVSFTSLEWAPNDVVEWGNFMHQLLFFQKYLPICKDAQRTAFPTQGYLILGDNNPLLAFTLTPSVSHCPTLSRMRGQCAGRPIGNSPMRGRLWARDYSVLIGNLNAYGSSDWVSRSFKLCQKESSWTHWGI